MKCQQVIFYYNNYIMMNIIFIIFKGPSHQIYTLTELLEVLRDRYTRLKIVGCWLSKSLFWVCLFFCFFFFFFLLTGVDSIDFGEKEWKWQSYTRQFILHVNKSCIEKQNKTGWTEYSHCIAHAQIRYMCVCVFVGIRGNAVCIIPIRHVEYLHIVWDRLWLSHRT